MTRILRDRRLASRLVMRVNHPLQGGAGLAASSRPSVGSSAVGAVVQCGGNGTGAPPCPTTTMLERVMTGLASVRDPRLVRERFEEELRTIVHAKSVRLRDDLDGDSPAPGVISCELPGRVFEGRPRLEAVF